MKRRGFTRPLTGAAFVFLIAGMMSQALTTPQPRSVNPAGRSSKSQQTVKSFDEELTSIDLSADQKAKVEQIRLDYSVKMDLVAKDTRIDSGQRGAFLDGYRRLEARQIWQVLTPDQQTEMRKRMLAGRAALQAQSRIRRKPLAAPPGAAPNAQPASEPQ